MKSVLLLSIFAFFVISCGEESKPTPAEKKITPATMNSFLLIPLASGNKWTYDGWSAGSQKNFELTMELTDVGIIYDKPTKNNFNKYNFLFWGNEANESINSLVYDYSFNLDTLIQYNADGNRGLFFYPYKKGDNAGTNNGLVLWLENSEVNGFVFDMVYVYRLYIGDVEVFMSLVKGIGLVYYAAYYQDVKIEEYKIKSAVLK